MKAIQNQTISAHNGTSSVGGMFIDETFLNGEVIRVNKKSIRCKFTEEVHTRNGKEVSRKSIDRVETFSFWKELDNGEEVYYAAINCFKFLVRI